MSNSKISYKIKQFKRTTPTEVQEINNLNALYLSFDTNAILDNKRWWYIFSESKDNYICIAKNKQEVIGFGILHLMGRPHMKKKCFGRIEDVVVHPDYRSRGVATTIIQELLNKAKSLLMYKVELSCREELVPFYQRLNFVEDSVTMRINL